MAAPNSSNTSSPLTFLCLASYEKGHTALTELKRQGCRVFLLTSLSLKEKAKFPRESLDDIFYLHDRAHQWDSQELIKGVSHLARTVEIDRVMALDDLDVERAALLREHLRLPGFGETAARYFRDKLAMRMRASQSGVPVPPFTDTFNYEKISRFLETVPGPWVLKPRLLAGAIGIQKFDHTPDLWDRVHTLGDEQGSFVLEQFVPGEIFHVDSIWFRGQMVYAVASAYGTPPLQLTTGGGVFTTRMIEHGSDGERALCSMNQQVLESFGLTDGVSHTEFIRARHDGTYYFLETSARVGGAHIADLIEQATGLNLWAEWTKVEVAAARNLDYNLPSIQHNYAGLLVSLARQEWPDTSGFNDPELVWRLEKRHHVGFILKSARLERVEQLMAWYGDRIERDYQASAPPRQSLIE